MAFSLRKIWNNIFKHNGKIVNGFSLNAPLWASSFGNDIYTSDIVLACIHAIAEECSKMVVKSVKVKSGLVVQNDDDLNTLFDTRPNVLMTMKDLLYWVAWRLETRYNAFIFPEKEVITYADGTTRERIVALYPIDSVGENIIYNEQENRYYLHFTMRGGGEYQVPYDLVLHLRKHFEANNLFFADTERKELLKTLQACSLVQDLIPKGIQASMQTKGVLTANSLADAKGLTAFKEQFEKTAQTGNSAIAVLDVSGQFTPINVNPQVIDSNTMTFLENKILKNFGVPASILFGNATENEWASFYQKNIEPFKIEFEQVATTILFTKDKLNFGNRIRCYDKLVQHYTIATRLNIVKELGARNYLSRAEQRELLGFEPDGGPEKVSLNFVDSDKANQYQGVDTSEDEGGNTNVGESN